EKRVFLVILFTSFSGSLVSRIPGAVQDVFSGLPVNYLLIFITLVIVLIIYILQGLKYEANRRKSESSH
ncbi:hypothetical protein, partial [Escherichia coli]|uniref:hypothetical protein n=1 Tax=Escherichia coli TaxID=562 RepID=UPI003B8612FC